VFEAWTSEVLSADPFDVIVTARLETEAPLPPLIRSLTLSPFHPPPQHLRMRGHFLYLAIVTLEGATVHVSATSRGYYVDRSSESSGFNPAPRHNGHFHTSLLALLASESPAFVRGLQSRLEPVPMDIPDALAAAVPVATIPATPWLVARPKVDADPLRSQLAYLGTGQLQPDISPSTSRDWNEEFVTMRELPRKTPQERLNRDRMLGRLQTEFSNAAAKAVVSIVRGELIPINPMETRAQHTYLHNNILLVSAEDPQGQHAHLGRDEAVRVTTIKDLNGVRVLNALDLEGVHSIATCVVDYLGERWVAQALLPGLLGPVKPEDPPVATSDQAQSNGDGKLEEIDVDIEAQAEAKPEANSGPTEETGPAKPPTEPKAEPGFKIIYGSSDTERPDQGAFTVEPKMHEIAAKLAHHLHLCSHRVKDHGTETTHEMWTPMEVKGILGTDNRFYFIDLCASLALRR
jgi:protein TIF31